MKFGTKFVIVAFKLYVCDDIVVPEPNPLTVESCTTYCVKEAGFVPLSHATVIDVALTDVQVLETVAGTVAKVAVVI